MDEKITIIDVARKAGVSKGTVDRVLHNRGEVSAKSAEKVRKAIEDLNFSPNMYASLLASKKAKIFACIMPHFKKSEFWEKVYNGFMRGGALMSAMNVRVQVYFYDQYNVASFREAAAEALKSRPDGVLMPTLFHDETAEFAARLSKEKIPYIYVDTKVETDTNHLAFIGMPRHDSGALGAVLLTERQRPQDIKEVLVVRIKRDGAGLSDPTKKRREGFLNYMAENFPETRIHSVTIDPSNQAALNRDLATFFQQHGNIRHVIMFNSRLYLIAKTLADFPVEGRRVIGFDDIPQNLALLREGLADVIIAQHVEDQSTKAVELLSDYILSHKSPERTDNYVHIDILTKYNIENY